MNADLNATIQYLKTFESIQGPVKIDQTEKSRVIQALEAIKPASDYQIFGILADTYDEAIAS